MVDIRAAKDVCPLEEPLLSPRSPTHNPERIKDDIKDQDRPVSLKVAPSDLRTASEETSLKEEDSTTKQSCLSVIDQTGIDSTPSMTSQDSAGTESREANQTESGSSSIHVKESTPEHLDEGQSKEETSTVEEEKSSPKTSKTILISPVVSPMRGNISSLRFRILALI